MKIGILDKQHSRNEIRGYPTTKNTSAGMSIASRTGGRRREERGQKNGDDLREERGEAERKRQGRK